MKITTINYILKEGIINVFRQKLMAFATITIIIASFLILGVFLLLIINFNRIIDTASKQPHLNVYCFSEIGEKAAGKVESTLVNNPNIESVTKITKSEAFQKAKEIFRDQLEYIDEADFLPVTFQVQLKDPEMNDAVIAELENINNVEKIDSPVEVVKLIVKIKAGVKWVSFIILLMLAFISVLIVSNAIRLAVHSRKREINIMKYVGATDRFIRGPFVVEGILIGFTGAVIAYFLLEIIYSYFLVGVDQTGIFQMLSVDFVRPEQWINTADFGLLFGIYMTVRTMFLTSFILFGILLGTVGSVISIRKYLKV